jgi:hypothetical protein
MKKTNPKDRNTGANITTLFKSLLWTEQEMMDCVLRGEAAPKAQLAFKQKTLKRIDSWQKEWVRMLKLLKDSGLTPREIKVALKKAKSV